MKIAIPIFVAFAALIATSAAAQPAAPTCSAAAYRQMDFWVGDWDLSFDAGNGAVGTAANSITRDGFGDCVITERFSMPNGYEGSSYSMYDPHAGLWRQMWVDNQGGVFVLTGGPVEDQDHVFELVTTMPVGADQTVRRMIWQEVSDDALTWRWQRQTEDGAWEDAWVLRYQRRAP